MKEHEIRPREVFEEYLKLSKEDILEYFSDHSLFVPIPCPACKSEQSEIAFVKHDFSYRQCNDCYTLFVSPRPTEEMIIDFYKTSKSSKFWAERFFPETAESRREKIFIPRVELLIETISRMDIPKPMSLVDVGAGFGIFLEEINKRGIFYETLAIEPSFELAKTCRVKGISVLEKAVENIDEGEVQASIATSFEVFEHLFNPEAFLNSMKKLLKPGGILLFTSLTISGLDLLVLGKNSKSISPPHHLNFFSIEGLKMLVERCGLEVIDICTPGKLDVDIIKNTYDENPDLEIPNFLNYIFKYRSPEFLEKLQGFLQQNNLSSHVRVIARK